MVDFAASLRQGFDSADTAKKNREEINSVFSELNVQLAAVTEGKLAIKIKRLNEAGLFGIPGPKYLAIAAINPTVSGSQFRELAKWTQHDSGYPCTIKFGKNEYVCVDKSSLEETLAAMLEDPRIGEILQDLLNLKPVPPTENQGTPSVPTNQETP